MQEPPKTSPDTIINNIVGMSYDAAKTYLEVIGYTICVTRDCGVYQIVTRDYRTDRVNVELERDNDTKVVVSWSIG